MVLVRILIPRVPDSNNAVWGSVFHKTMVIRQKMVSSEE